MEQSSAHGLPTGPANVPEAPPERSASAERRGAASAGSWPAPAAPDEPLLNDDDFSAPPADSLNRPPDDIQRLLSIEVPVIVELAHRKLSVAEVTKLGTGAIIEFVKSAEEHLDLRVNNKTVGTGVAVKVGENFGIRIHSMGTPAETIAKLGG